MADRGREFQSLIGACGTARFGVIPGLTLWALACLAAPLDPKDTGFFPPLSRERARFSQTFDLPVKCQGPQRDCFQVGSHIQWQRTFCLCFLPSGRKQLLS